jgi:hypothetical protein
MSVDPVRGTTVRWSYEDGPVAGKTFEHTFGTDGMVVWRQADAGPGAPAVSAEASVKYEAARISEDVYVVSYLATSGWALTTVVDAKARRVISFASNEKMLVVQHGRLID